MTIFDHVSETDRWLLAAALSSFADKLSRDRADHLVVETAEQLRSSAVRGLEPPTPPEGVEIDAAAFFEALATVRATNSFSVYLSSSLHLQDVYDLVVETNRPQSTHAFVVARGMSGSGEFFQLDEEDRRFAAQVEHAVFMASGHIPTIGSNEVVTLTMPWGDLDGINPEIAVRDYVASLVGHEARVRESLIDDHPKFREEGYAEVTAYVGGPSAVIADLRLAEAARLEALGDEMSATL